MTRILRHHGSHREDDGAIDWSTLLLVLCHVHENASDWTNPERLNLFRIGKTRKDFSSAWLLTISSNTYVTSKITLEEPSLILHCRIMCNSVQMECIFYHVVWFLCMHSFIPPRIDCREKRYKRRWTNSVLHRPGSCDNFARGRIPRRVTKRTLARTSGKCSRMLYIGSSWGRLKKKDYRIGKLDPISSSFTTLCQPIVLKERWNPKLKRFCIRKFHYLHVHHPRLIEGSLAGPTRRFSSASYYMEKRVTDEEKKNLIKYIQNQSALIKDSQKIDTYNLFCEESKNVIPNSDNVTFFELCEISSKMLLLFRILGRRRRLLHLRELFDSCRAHEAIDRREIRRIIHPVFCHYRVVTHVMLRLMTNANTIKQERSYGKFTTSGPNSERRWVLHCHVERETTARKQLEACSERARPHDAHDTEGRFLRCGANNQHFASEGWAGDQPSNFIEPPTRDRPSQERQWTWRIWSVSSPFSSAWTGSQFWWPHQSGRSTNEFYFSFQGVSLSEKRRREGGVNSTPHRARFTRANFFSRVTQIAAFCMLPPTQSSSRVFHVWHLSWSYTFIIYTQYADLFLFAVPSELDKSQCTASRTLA